MELGCAGVPFCVLLELSSMCIGSDLRYCMSCSLMNYHAEWVQSFTFWLASFPGGANMIIVGK